MHRTTVCKTDNMCDKFAGITYEANWYYNFTGTTVLASLLCSYSICIQCPLGNYDYNYWCDYYMPQTGPLLLLDNTKIYWHDTKSVTVR